MNSTPGGTPGNGFAWRVAELERRLMAVEQGQPAVVADRVGRLEGDVKDLRSHLDRRFDHVEDQIEKGDKENSDENANLRKILISTWVSLATGLVIAYVLGGGGVPGG